jgi:hypothetical protein
MSWIAQLAVGSVMIGLTVLMHAVCLDAIMRHARQVEVRFQRLFRRGWKPLLSAVTVVAIFSIHVAQIWMWAILLYGLRCAPLVDFETALRFATATYTTVGDSPIVLDTTCRTLGGVAGANGFLLFGWTTAFIFEVIAQFYRKEAANL